MLIGKMRKMDYYILLLHIFIFHFDISIFIYYFSLFFYYKTNTGFFCNATYGPVENYAIYPCPTGHYCPDGTTHSTRFPCPRGTFRNTTKGENPDDCEPCSAGFACDQEGISQPVTPCSPGYYCRFGANTTTPRLGNNADECFTGHYCEEGILFSLIKVFISLNFE